MPLFKNLIMEEDEYLGAVRIAGIEETWHRAMMISDIGFTDELAHCHPVKSAFDPALAVVEFYNRQKLLDHKETIVIDVHKTYTDMTYLKKSDHTYLVRKSIRIDEGTDMMTEILLENPSCTEYKDAREQVSDFIFRYMCRRHMIKEELFYRDKNGYKLAVLKRNDLIAAIRQFISMLQRNIKTFLYSEQVESPVFVLSGRLWLFSEAVDIFKNDVFHHEVRAYRPEAASLLGSAYMQEKIAKQSESVMITDHQWCLQCRDIWGNVNRLTIDQQKNYWRLLEAILAGNSEILMYGTGDDLHEIYLAMRVDFPKISMIWNYGKTTYVNLGSMALSMMQLYIQYQSSQTLLTEIEQKAVSILKECVSDGSESADHLILQKLYNYISKNYHYTREKEEDHNYPEYAYTLETLMKNGVCHGYAISFVYLCHFLQIPMLYICGDADGEEMGGHAWNMLQMGDGVYRHIDVTWDLEKIKNCMPLQYFLLDDIEMNSRRHFWDRQNYPVCV